MSELRFTLVGEGPSDKALVPILKWLLLVLGVELPIQSSFHTRKGISLAAKIREAINLFPCDLIFVHRDADTELRENRRTEILTALRAGYVDERLPCACVVPVRMTEAWLLIDEGAIRRASGNPRGTQNLNLPDVNRLESLPDPKGILADCLKAACGLHGRRLKQFQAYSRVAQLADLLADTGGFLILRQLEAFQSLQRDVKEIVDSRGWNTHAAAP